MSGWIEIVCARCWKDSRYIHTLTQVRLGVWWCEDCVHRHEALIKEGYWS